MFFRKRVANTQHKIEHLASTKRTFCCMDEKSVEKQPQQSTSKNEVKRIFVRTEKTNERFDFQTVLFLINQNGGPDEKKKK